MFVSDPVLRPLLMSVGTSVLDVAEASHVFLSECKLRFSGTFDCDRYGDDIGKLQATKDDCGDSVTIWYSASC
ncbi:hypothetical protein D3C87_2063280 [compost metagenome]